MTFEEITVLAERQQRIIQGKEKFIQYLRTFPVQGNIQMRKKYTALRGVSSVFGEVDVICVIRMDRLGPLDIAEMKLRGEVSSGCTLQFIVEGKEFEYESSVYIRYTELPLHLKQYWHDIVVNYDHARVLQSRTHAHYSGFSKDFDAIREAIFGNYSQHRAEMHIRIVNEKPHTLVLMDRMNTDVQYDDLQPVMSEDTYFNLTLDGYSTENIVSILSKMQYCPGLNSSEKLSPEMNDSFWLKCNEVLPVHQ